MRKTALTLSLTANLILIAVLIQWVYTFGGPRYFWFRVTHSGVTGLSHARGSVFTAPSGVPNPIVMLGDSLTQTCEWHELFQNPRVVNRGITGEWANELPKRLDPIIAMQPTQVFIMSGINDLRSQTPDQVAQSLRRTVHYLHTANSEMEIYVQSLLPVNNRLNDTGRSNGDIRMVNQRMATLCAEYACTYIDLHAHFSDPEGNLWTNMTSDGVHINRAGYQLWADQISTLVNQSIGTAHLSDPRPSQDRSGPPNVNSSLPLRTTRVRLITPSSLDATFLTRE